MAFFVLTVSVLTAAIILLGMPELAERLLGMTDAAEKISPSLTESVYILAIFIPLMFAGWIGAALSPNSRLRLGERPLLRVGWGMAMGASGVGVALLHSWAAGLLGRGITSPLSLAHVAVGTLLVAIQATSEEVFFRGWLQPVLVSNWGVPAGLGVTSLSFAALHMTSGTMQPLSFLNMILGGILFGVLALQQRGIAGASAAHAAWNWSEQYLLGLDPNPGVGSLGSIINLEIAGPSWWGGSAQGLNASLGMTSVLLALVSLYTATIWPAHRRPVVAAA